MSGKHERGRVERLFGHALEHRPATGWSHPKLDPAIKAMIRQMINEYEQQLGELKEYVSDYADMRAKLDQTQKALIVALMKMGGKMELYAGQMNEIQDGWVVGVRKLAVGEGDRVPLEVYCRPPGGEPPTNDLRRVA